MAATAIHRLTLDPMGKCSNAFFSETTNNYCKIPIIFGEHIFVDFVGHQINKFENQAKYNGFFLLFMETA
jgi:hypothetical protein